MRHKSAFTLLFLLLSLVLAQYALAAQIRLAWNANMESDLGGYKVYYGTITKAYTLPIDAGNVTTFNLTGLTQGQTYYIAVTAYDTSYNESGFSIEVYDIATQAEPLPPAPAPTITPTPIPTPTPTVTPTTTPTPNLTPTPPSDLTPAQRYWWWKHRRSAFKRWLRLRTFFGLAYVDEGGSPIGNLKSYEISTLDNPGNPNNLSKIVLVDSTHTSVLDANNQIRESAKSFWSPEVDGKQVDKGGVGEVLLSRTSPRNIITNIEGENLMTESNKFAIENDKLTPELLGFALKDTAERKKLIQYVHGYDAFVNEKGISELKKRKWILGTIINSRPLVIPYESLQSVVFVGANDGMLHAFDAATGEELWGFIPDDLLGRLATLMTGRGYKYFVDGSPKAYIGDSRKIIIFGLRRGGSHYYALDVTHPEKPKFLWKIGPKTKDYSEIGQSWSIPQIGKIRYGNGEKVVCFIGGGYDENQDKNILMTPDRKGRAVFAVDLFTGKQLWRWDNENDPNMKHSIPSDISCVDTNGDGYIDRLYVGDTGGRLWRFDMNTPDPKSWSGRILFDTKAERILSDTKTEAKVNPCKIFYRPDVTLEDGYEMVFFGTGDREHPNGIKTVNKFFAIRDIGVNSPFSEKDLVDVTKGTATVQDFDNKRGWFFSLAADKGEKVFAPPVVLFKVVYFSTFTPPTEKDDSNGIARLYALDYRNGGPILDLNPSNNLFGEKIDLSDRSKVIGNGFPSNTVISVFDGKPIAMTGFSGGVYNTPIKKNSTIIPVWWKEVKK